MFITCYSLMRQVAGVTFWNGTFFSLGTQILIVAYYLCIYIFTIWKVIPECLISACVAFAMPPYVDSDNYKLALACVQHAGDIRKRQSECLRQHVVAVTAFGPNSSPTMSPQQSPMSNLSPQNTRLGGDFAVLERRPSNLLHVVSEKTPKHTVLGLTPQPE